MPEVEIHGSLKNLSNAPDIAFQFAPNGAAWASVAAAHNGTPEAYRAIGKCRFVDVGDGRGIIEYMYKTGITVTDLVPRYENLESAQQYLDLIEAQVELAEYHAGQSQLFAEMSAATYDPKGPYDPVSNVPPLTADASVNPGPKPKEYTIYRPGPLQFATEGQLVGYLVEENDTLRELSNGKWFVHRDPNAKKVLDLEKQTRISIPFTAPFTAANFGGGLTFPSNGTMQIDPGVTGQGTYLVKSFELASNPDTKVGDKLSLVLYVTESVPGISFISAIQVITNTLLVLRNGATVTGAITNAKQTRVAENKMVYTLDYIVVAGDTVLYEVITKGNNTNQSASPWVWQITGVELIPQTLRVGKNLLEDTLYSHNKRLTTAETLLGEVADDVSDISEKLVFPNLADPLQFQHQKVMGTDGNILTNSGYCLSGKIKVTPGLTYWGRTHPTSPTSLMAYGVYFNASNAILGGFNGVQTPSVVPPLGTDYVRVTVKESESSTFMFEQGPASTAFLAFGKSRTKDLKMSADDIEPTALNQTVSPTQIVTWDKSAIAAEKIIRKNLIDPDKVTLDKLMQSNGQTVNSLAWVHSDFIPVTFGLRYRGNSSLTSSYRYSCCYDINKVRVNGGWDAQWKDDYTPLAGVAYIILTIVKTELGTAYFEQAETLNGFTPYTDMTTKGLHQPANYVSESATRAFVTPTAKTRLDNLSFVDNNKWLEYQLKGIVPKMGLGTSPIKKDLSVFLAYLLGGTGDVITDVKNGSKSTGVAGYCSPTPNSHLKPEFCREQNKHALWCDFMLETYFPGQKSGRFDDAGRFTITGNIDTSAGSGYLGTNNARHWGHQWPDGAGNDFGGPVPNGQVFFDRFNQIIKPITGNAVISFALPNSYVRMAWMLSHSHLTGEFSFTVAGGAGKLLYLVDRDTDTWADLHNAIWNTATADSFKTGVNYTIAGITSTKIRLDQYSMPLIIKRAPGATISESTVITATMKDGKQIEHWGVYYSRQNRLFIPSSSAMGSHASPDLEQFDETGIDKRKPQFIAYDVDLVNQWRVGSVTPTDTPTDYAGRITGYATTLVTKPYIKGVLCRFGMWHVNMNLFDTLIDMPTPYYTAAGWNTGIDYMNLSKNGIGALVVNPTYAGKIAMSDAQPACMSYTLALAKEKGITRRAAQYISNPTDPPNTDSLLMDATHNGNKGERLEFEYDKPNWIPG